LRLAVPHSKRTVKVFYWVEKRRSKRGKAPTFSICETLPGDLLFGEMKHAGGKDVLETPSASVQLHARNLAVSVRCIMLEIHPENCCARTGGRSRGLGRGVQAGCALVQPAPRGVGLCVASCAVWEGVLRAFRFSKAFMVELGNNKPDEEPQR
jgi:hypothetical protein